MNNGGLQVSKFVFWERNQANGLTSNEQMVRDIQQFVVSTLYISFNRNLRFLCSEILKLAERLGWQTIVMRMRGIISSTLVLPMVISISQSVHHNRE